MALLVRKIPDINHINSRLRGGIVAGKDIRKGVFELYNKTLEFTAPAGTVTFTTPNSTLQDSLTVKEILTQIDAVLGAGWAKVDAEGHLIITDPTGAVAVILAGASTADGLLGFDGNGVSGTLYNPPGGSAPALVSLSTTPVDSNTYLLITDEA